MHESRRQGVSGLKYKKSLASAGELRRWGCVGRRAADGDEWAAPAPRRPPTPGTRRWGRRRPTSGRPGGRSADHPSPRTPGPARSATSREGAEVDAAPEPCDHPLVGAARSSVFRDRIASTARPTVACEPGRHGDGHGVISNHQGRVGADGGHDAGRDSSVVLVVEPPQRRRQDLVRGSRSGRPSIVSTKSPPTACAAPGPGQPGPEGADAGRPSALKAQVQRISPLVPTESCEGPVTSRRRRPGPVTGVPEPWSASEPPGTGRSDEVPLSPEDRHRGRRRPSPGPASRAT